MQFIYYKIQAQYIYNFNTVVSFHKHYKVIHNKSHKNIKAIKPKGNIKHIKHTILENGMYFVQARI